MSRTLYSVALVALVGCTPIADKLIEAGEDLAEGVVPEDAELRHISVSSNVSSLEVGDRTTLSVVAEYDDGSVVEVAHLVDWDVNKAGIVEMDGSTLNAVGAGAVRIKASMDGMTSDRLAIEVLAEAGSPAPSGKADLTIGSVTPVMANGQLSYDVRIDNDGGATSAATYVDIYLNQTGAPSPGELGEHYANVPSIDPGASKTVSLSAGSAAYDGCETGCTSWAQVDAEKMIAESNEANNVFGPVAVSTSTSSTPGQPDLNVFDVSWWPTASGWDVEFTVENIGTADAGTFDVDFYSDRSTAPSTGIYGDDWDEVTSLAVGDEVTLILASALDCASGCSAWIQADSQGTVAEANEGNNVLGPLAIQSAVAQSEPNLRITSMTATNTTGKPEYAITVINDGTADAGYFEIDVEVNQSYSPSPTDNGDFYYSVPNGLAAGQSQTFTMTSTLSCNSGCSSWAMLDVTGKLAESDETDNVHGPLAVNGPASTGLAELEVTGLTMKESYYAMWYEVTVVNNGTADATAVRVDIFPYNGFHMYNWGDTNPDATSTEALIPAGGSATVAVYSTGASYTECQSGCFNQVVVDTLQTIDESDDQNNSYSPTSMFYP
jgi:hypothetical protein